MLIELFAWLIQNGLKYFQLRHQSAYFLHNHLKNTGPIHLNKGSHRESMEYYTEDMKKEVFEKDRLIFKLMKLSE